MEPNPPNPDLPPPPPVHLQRPGVYCLPADAYHADPAPAPSLSASIATMLCTTSPMHAQMAHPRLTPTTTTSESASHFDIGTAAHSVFLEGVDRVDIIDAPDWRTKLARELREESRAKGRIPLLAHHAHDVANLVMAMRVQLDDSADGREMFRNGEPEQTLLWQEDDGTWCRARLDWLRDGAIDDLKTVGVTANPDVCSRTLFGWGYDVQAAFYLRGLKKLTGEDAIFRFAFVETTAPYAVSILGLGPDVLMLAEKKVRYALELWRRCLDTNEWPGYPHRTCWATLPPWEESRWLDKETRGPDGQRSQDF